MCVCVCVFTIRSVEFPCIEDAKPTAVWDTEKQIWIILCPKHAAVVATTVPYLPINKAIALKDASPEWRNKFKEAEETCEEVYTNDEAQRSPRPSTTLASPQKQKGWRRV